MCRTVDGYDLIYIYIRIFFFGKIIYILELVLSDE